MRSFLTFRWPSMNGFELLTRLKWQPLVIFTTAYDEYALRAFEVNSIDYLLNPSSQRSLARALSKLKLLKGGAANPPPENFRHLLEELASAMRAPTKGFRHASLPASANESVSSNSRKLPISSRKIN